MELANETIVNQKKKGNHKAIKAIGILLVMVAIAVVVALIIHNMGGSAPASTNVKNGLSAYELAVQYGYEGTVQEWLSSLSGKSAYEIAKENGYSGTEAEWSASLKATAGKDGVGIKTAAFSKTNELLITLTDGTVLNLGVADGLNGKDGANGKDGVDGKDGEIGPAGKDGVSITAANVNEEGQLVLAFSDGKIVNLDKLVGINGKDGIGIASSEINANGELVITYTNGQTANLGVVVGAKGDKGEAGAQGAQGEQGIQGEKGDKGETGAQGQQGIQGEKGDTGADGKTGVSITKTEINNNGELVITLSDNSVSNLGVVVGAKGDKGDNGAQGIQGEKGEQGISVTGAEINSNGELVLIFSNNQRSNVGNVIGAKGDKGDTGAQGQQGIQGEKGDKGDTGADGKNGVSVAKTEINNKGELVITLSDNTVSNLGVVVGAKGDKGDKGDTGAQGIQGEQGIQGVQGEKGDTGAAGKDGVGIETITIDNGNLKITLTNETTLDLGSIKGETGAQGIQGEKGDKGETGATGEAGVGIASADINAYGELVLIYTDGSDTNLGVVVGAKGEKGDTGAQGEKGDTGAQGIQGEKGDKGDTGATGEAGVGVESVAINNDGELVIVYTNDDEINLGKVVGPQGAQGIQGEKGDQGEQGIQGEKGDTGTGISKVEITNDELVITLSDSSIINLGNIKGEKGDKGDKGDTGAQGEQGVSITNVTLTADGDLSMTFSNGNTINLGNIKGADGQDGVGIAEVYIQDGNLYMRKINETVATNLGSVKGEKGDKGDQGEQGIQGIQGEKGADGRGIVKTEIINGQLWITYTDDPENPVNIGSVAGDDAESVTDGDLIYILLEDGTYGVKAADGFSLTELIIPEKHNNIPVTKILDNGFKDQKGIVSVSFPTTLKSMGRYAFAGCTGIKDVEIPSETTFIGAFAFFNSGVENITLATPSYWLSGSSDFTYKYYSRSYNSGSTDLNDRMAISIKVYDISDTQKAALALSQSVSVSYMQVVYRDGYSGTTTTTYDNETFHWYAEDWNCNIPTGDNQALTFVLQDNGTFSVKASAMANTVTEIVIPETYKGKTVNTIAEEGFKGLTNLEKITIPSTITGIKSSAFSGCTSLEVNIPESVKTINPYALYNVKTITVSGTNSWSGTGASWREYFGSSLIDSGTKSFSSRQLSASSYSQTATISPTRGGDSAYMSPWTATWTR